VVDAEGDGGAGAGAGERRGAGVFFGAGLGFSTAGARSRTAATTGEEAAPSWLREFSPINRHNPPSEADGPDP
jgi:hypothetical protein